MQKGSALIILVLIGLVVIFGGGYFYFNYKNNPQTSPPTPNKQKDTLEIYTNKDLGFKFKYSVKDLTVKEDSEEEFNKRGNGEFRKNFTSYVAYPPAEFLGAIVVLEKGENFDTNPFTLWVFNNGHNLTEYQWYEKYWYYPFVWGDYTARRNDVAPAQDATISGQLALYGIVTYQEGSPKFIYLSRGEKMYLFRIIGEAGEKILQSFKLLNGSDKNTGGCVVAGCSGQLCVEEVEKDIITTCEFKEEYACYKNARCERQENGKCGWSRTEQLTQCLEEKRESSPNTTFF